MMEGITLTDYEKAEAELRAKEGRSSFFVHAAIYVLVNILLLVINLVVVPGFLALPSFAWRTGYLMKRSKKS